MTVRAGCVKAFARTRFRVDSAKASRRRCIGVVASGPIGCLRGRLGGGAGEPRPATLERERKSWRYPLVGSGPPATACASSIAAAEPAGARSPACAATQAPRRLPRGGRAGSETARVRERRVEEGEGAADSPGQLARTPRHRYGRFARPTASRPSPALRRATVGDASCGTEGVRSASDPHEQAEFRVPMRLTRERQVVPARARA
jgi:hypothetical protein